MTTSGSQADSHLKGTLGPPGQLGASAEVLRAAADFIESAGLRSGLYVMAGDGEVRIQVWQHFGDAAARHATLTKLAGLIGGTIRQDDSRDHALADLRADGAISGLRAVVETSVLVRRAGALKGPGKPLAESPGGQITAVPGKPPEGWRWVTELDAKPRYTRPWQPRRSAGRDMPPSTAPQLAARDCPPLTSGALRAAGTEPAAPASRRAQRAAHHGRNEITH